MDGVSFYVDDRERQNDPYRSESTARYDLAGTQWDGTAQGYDAGQLGVGSHAITAEITLMDGTTVRVTANFEVEATQISPPPLTAENYSLLWSASANRSNAAPLDEATLPETAYVFTDPDQGVLGVSFYLDDPNRQRNPYRSESFARYDLAGTQVDGNANGYDTGQLSNGEHTLTVKITLADGSTEIRTATFSVLTPVVAPLPPLPPESYGLRWSSSSNRSNHQYLAGAIVSGNIYVYTNPDQGVDSVDFYLSNTENPYRTETAVPYDLAGTRNDDRARPFDSSQLGIGMQTISAVIHFIDGGRVIVSSDFFVAPTPVASIEIDPQTAILAAGSTIQLTPTLRDAAGNLLTDRDVIWTSSNLKVTVFSIGSTFLSPFFDLEGVVTYGSEPVEVFSSEAGEVAVITATADGVSATAVIRVFFAFSSISAGANHTCGITPAGDAYCWGAGSLGRLGNNAEEDQDFPVPVSGFEDFRSVSAGSNPTCGITEGGDAYWWGAGSFNRLGNGSTENQLSPEAVSGGLKFKSLSAGNQRTCGITLEDYAYCWGSGFNGGLGTGSTADQSEPQAVAGNYKFKSISTSADEGGFHTCGVTISGDAYCWGRGWHGQLGDGADGVGYFQEEPVAVLGGHKFTSVSTGGHTCGLTTLGKIFCWGSSQFGQLGNGSESNENEPVRVSGERTYLLVSAGSFHTCAVAVNRFIYCWGDGNNGKLGVGFVGNVNRTTPTLAASPPNDISSVSAGTNHTCAVSREDEAFCWGNDFFGQLGNGVTDADVVAPFPVSMPEVFRQICRIDNVPGADDITPHGDNNG